MSRTASSQFLSNSEMASAFSGPPWPRQPWLNPAPARRSFQTGAVWICAPHSGATICLSSVVPRVPWYLCWSSPSSLRIQWCSRRAQGIDEQVILTTHVPFRLGAHFTIPLSQVSCMSPMGWSPCPVDSEGQRPVPLLFGQSWTLLQHGKPLDNTVGVYHSLCKNRTFTPPSLRAE